MSASTSEPPLKRQRTDEGEQRIKSISDIEKHDTLWFDDGNIILLAHDVPLGFRLHRSILSVHSEVFKGMFAFPSNMDDNETMEGCAVVRLQDCGEDLSLFFTLFYYGAKHPFFDANEGKSFRDVRAMVYLSFKYEAQVVQTTAVSLLRTYYPSDLASYYSSLERIGDDLEIVDELMGCITAVNLARKFHIPELLPAALHECTIFCLSQLLDPVDYGPSGSEQLSHDDVRLCLRAVTEFDNAVMKRLDVFTSFAQDEYCMGFNSCTTAVNLLLQHLKSSSVFTRAMAFKPIEDKFEFACTVIADEEGAHLCPCCREQILDAYTECRTKLWAELPRIFNLESSGLDSFQLSLRAAFSRSKLRAPTYVCV